MCVHVHVGLCPCVCVPRGGLAGITYLVSYPDPHRSCGWNTSPPTRVVGLVSSCTNFCPVAPECCSDQSDLRYALIAFSSYQSKLSVMAVKLELEMDDVLVLRAIQSAGERMGYAKVKDKQFRVIEDVVRGRDTFVSLPTGYGVLICYGYLFHELSNVSRPRTTSRGTKQATHNRAKKTKSEKRCHSRSSS